MKLHIGLGSILISTLTLGMTAPAMAEYKGGHSGMHGYGHKGAMFKSLTKEQKSTLIKLGIAHKKAIVLTKLNMKKIKVELALLTTSDKPNNAAIAKKVAELVAVKKTLIMAKVKYKIAMRKELTADQKNRFDMRVLGKATRGKRGCGGYHGMRRGHHGMRRGYHGRRHHGKGGHGMGMGK